MDLMNSAVEQGVWSAIVVGIYLVIAKIIDTYKEKNIFYLQDSNFEFEGVNFYGSPYSPSFFKEHWVFNADRGEEIRQIWGKIPINTDILITHTPPFNILDYVPNKNENENENVGCKDLSEIIKSKLKNLKLHCFGHIHGNYGVIHKNGILYSNGAILDNNYKIEVNKIYINFKI